MKVNEVVNTLFDLVAKEIDITKSQHEKAVISYNAVGEWLADDPSLQPLKPSVRPQGSFMLGTMIRPITDDDDLDVDLVCEMSGKPVNWTQKSLKDAVGKRLKEHGTYSRILAPEGRRCWTLKYADGSHFHLDVLPAVVDSAYSVLLEKSFSQQYDEASIDNLAIRISDKHSWDFNIETNEHNWLKSNPFGYARWFVSRSTLNSRRLIMCSESVEPMKRFQEEKTVLQKIVQLLKRHRDIKFDGDEDKPISIIITTLAAKSYNGDTELGEAFTNIIHTMPNLIEERFDSKHMKKVKWIANPVNHEENFADKWVEYPERERKFYKWLQMLHEDVATILSTKDNTTLINVLGKIFGEQTAKNAANRYGSSMRIEREKGRLNVIAGSGMVSTASVANATTILAHNFHGEE